MEGNYHYMSKDGNYWNTHDFVKVLKGNLHSAHSPCCLLFMLCTVTLAMLPDLSQCRNMNSATAVANLTLADIKSDFGERLSLC
jgi:hypothetical protein